MSLLLACLIHSQTIFAQYRSSVIAIVICQYIQKKHGDCNTVLLKAELETLESKIIIANRPRANNKSSDSNYVVENFFVLDSASTSDDDNAIGPDTGNEKENISPKVRNTLLKVLFKHAFDN